jgi:hypothetical protein
VKLVDADRALFTFGRPSRLAGRHLPDQGRKAATKSAFLQGYWHRSSPSLKGVGHGRPHKKWGRKVGMAAIKLKLPAGAARAR